jgi:hypothetical protein
MFLDKIAALAGVCRSTVRNAIRKAAAAGLVRVQERRATWWRNLSNVIRVLDAGWRKWLARGRAQNPDRHDYEDIPEGCRSLNVHGGVIPFRETESAAWSARPRC